MPVTDQQQAPAGLPGKVGFILLKTPFFPDPPAALGSYCLSYHPYAADYNSRLVDSKRQP